MGRRRSRGTAISQKICYIQLKSCPISTIQFCARTCVQFNAIDIAYPYHTYVYISTPEHYLYYLFISCDFFFPSLQQFPPSTFPNSPLLFSFVIRCFIVTTYNRRINKDKIESKGNVEFFFFLFFPFSLDQRTPFSFILFANRCDARRAVSAAGVQQRGQRRLINGTRNIHSRYIFLYIVHLSREKI